MHSEKLQPVGPSPVPWACLSAGESSRAHSRGGQFFCRGPDSKSFRVAAATNSTADSAVTKQPQVIHEGVRGPDKTSVGKRLHYTRFPQPLTLRYNPSSYNPRSPRGHISAQVSRLLSAFTGPACGGWSVSCRDLGLHQLQLAPPPVLPGCQEGYCLILLKSTVILKSHVDNNSIRGIHLKKFFS